MGSLVAAAVGPQEWAVRLAAPFLLASTIEGFLLGVAVPKKVAQYAHPIITCAVLANLAAAVFALAAGWSYKQVLRVYLTKVGAPAERPG